MVISAAFGKGFSLNQWSGQMLKAPEDSAQPQEIASSLETCIIALDTPAADTVLGTVLSRLETIIDAPPSARFWIRSLEIDA